MRRFVYLGDRLGVVQIVKDAVLAHAIEKIIRIIGVEGAAFLQSPQLLDFGGGGQVEPLDIQFAERELGAFVYADRRVDDFRVVVDRAIGPGLGAQVTLAATGSASRVRAPG